MQELVNLVAELYKSHTGKDPALVDVLPQSGSDRRYFRIQDSDGTTVIGTHGLNVPENESFVYFSEQFHSKGLRVPRVLAVSDDKTVYLQQDFGNVSLMSILEEKGFVPEVYDLFKESLYQLAKLQVLGDEGLNYEKCLTNKEFGRQAIKADLFYFKYYFLDALQKPYDKQALGEDFDAISSYLTHTEYKYFMFRDFQSRNILITDDRQVHFIDYQGGMKGAPQYDVASMLWQARANLPDEWKESLLEDYMNSFETIVEARIDRDVFKSQYNGYVLIRLLQVLGAYGFRGLFERKAHFLTSIPQALKNLKSFLDNNSLGISVPEFKKVLTLCTDEEIITRFTPVQANEATPLVVKVSSFSYRNGVPVDSSIHGGGFVFDCRGIDNPGRHSEYKEIHGRDKPVMEYWNAKPAYRIF
jgi:aminoglycoside/choline kinase family phosphotransferase